MTFQNGTRVVLCLS